MPESSAATSPNPGSKPSSAEPAGEPTREELIRASWAIGIGELLGALIMLTIVGVAILAGWL